MKKVFVAMVLLPMVLLAQEAEKAEKKDVWEPFRYFVGTWEGIGTGNSGTAAVETEFVFVLQGQYLRVTNKAVFEPQEKNPEGEVHEDIGFISYDSDRGMFVLREFNVEGFVNRYVLDSIAADGKRLVFTAEDLENAPMGMGARLTFEIVNENEFRSIFDLAFPGKPLVCYSQNSMTRRE